MDREMSHGVFNKPMSCPDGHSFCHQCITQWLTNQTVCPVDRAPCGSLVRNRAVEGSVAKKFIKCPSSTSHPGGCSWTGPTSSLQDHLPRCDMKVVECDFKVRGCIFRAYQRELAQHHLICPHRTVKCSSCSNEIPHDDLSAHDEICVGKMVPCPNNCGILVERCKMLSHLAFLCAMEGRSCPLYSVGCTKVHSLEDADAMSHNKLLMQARVSGACNASVSALDGIPLAGSWQIDGEVTLPICSPVFEGHAAVVRLEIESASNISVKLHLESKLKLPCFGVNLRCCLHNGSDKVKFNTQEALMCQASVACVKIFNACPETVFYRMIRGSNPVVFDFLLTLNA